MNAYQNGAIIALAVGSLLAGACSKDEKKDESKPSAQTTTNPTNDKQGATPTMPAATGEKTAKVHCTGINACTGQGACKTPKNECAGKNACKGQGFVDVTEEECKSKGGTVATNVGM